MLKLQHQVQAYHRLLPRLYVWLFLASVFFTVGFSLGSRRNLTLGIALTSAILLEWMRLHGSDQVFRIRRRHSPQALEGDTVTVELEIENLSARPLHLIGITDRFAAGGGRRVRGVIRELLPRCLARFHFRQICDFRRGLFVLGPVQLSLADELGLIEKVHSVPVFTDLLVCPKPVPAFSLKLLAEGTAKDIGSEVIALRGRSEEFAGVRQYREGDAWRTIHWPTTARTSFLHVKEFDRNVVTQVTVFIDMFETGHAGLGAMTSFEQRLRVAGTLALTAVEKNHLVRLIGAQTPPVFTTLGGGTRHLQALLQWLALRAPRGRGCMNDVLLDQMPLIRRGSTLALVLSSTNLVLAALEQIIAVLRLKNVETIAVVVEDRSYHKLRPDQTELFAETPGLEEIVTRLRLAGARTYTLERRTDVVEGLRDYGERRGTFR